MFTRVLRDWEVYVCVVLLFCVGSYESSQWDRYVNRNWDKMCLHVVLQKISV
jgi:hypothetical protein